MSAAVAAEHPAALSGHKQRLLLLTLLLGAMVTMLNTAVAGVAIPTIAADLKASGIQIHLIGDGFAIALTSLVLLTGAIGDRYGRRRNLLAGLALMIPAAIMASFSTSANELIVWLMASGTAAAFLFPTTLSAISEMYPDAHARSRAVGLWAGCAAAGAALAPVLSGLILEHFHWGYVFLVSVPVAAITLIMGFFVMPEMKHAGAPPVDWIGGLFSIIGIGGLLLLVIFGPVEGWHQPVPLFAAAAVFGLSAFVIRQLKATHPLLDLRVFKHKPLTGGSLIIMILFAAMAGIMYLNAQFTQMVLGFSTLNAGLAILPLSVSVFIGAPLSAIIVRKIGARNTVMLGTILAACGSAIVFFWTDHSPYPVLFVTFVLLGLGIGFGMTPSTSAILDTLPPKQAGIASAVNDVTRDFGQSMGIAIMGSIASVTYAKVLSSGYESLTPEQQAQVPKDIAVQIQSSLAGALAVAQAYPGPNADQLLVAAREAFVAGLSKAGVLSTIMALVCLVIAFLMIPHTLTSNRGDEES